MWATILKLLASIAAYLSNKQLLDAGQAIGEAKKAEAENDIRKATKDIVKANAALSPDSVTRKLSKYQRKDK